MSIYLTTYHDLQYVVPYRFQSSESVGKLEEILKDRLSESANLQLIFCSQSYSFIGEKVYGHIMEELRTNFEYIDTLESLK